MTESIDEYIRLVTEIKSSVMAIQTSKYIEGHKKTLLLSLIDMMSRVAVEKHSTNKDRFVHFVNEFCEWKQSDYVSLPQLKIVLDRDKRRDLSQLKAFISDKMKKWPLEEAIFLEKDEAYGTVEALWPDGIKLMGKVQLKQFRHCELLWTYRNSYVHEMRAPGQPYKLYQTARPHYKPVFPLKWELIYPPEFLQEITERGINNLKRYLKRNNVNPFERYKNQDSWLELR